MKPSRPYALGLKRGVDVLLAGAGLVVLAPLLLLIGLGVYLDLGRPLLFRQRRIGRDERPFTLLKFRTMRLPTAPEQADRDRLTRFGRRLRRWSLDELPQLVNVLRGEMSIVGPRPLLPRYLPYYTPAERARHRMRPGLTGWAQIHGRSALDWDERLALDAWYVAHWSPGLDGRILLRSVRTVLLREGADADASALLPPLDVARKGMRMEDRGIEDRG